MLIETRDHKGEGMGRLILTMHVSADGYIARPDKTLWPGFGWPPAVQDRLNSIYRDAGLVLYGRGVYDAVVPWWSAVARGEAAEADVGAEGEEFARLLARLPKAVVSRKIPEPGDRTKVIRVDAVREIIALLDAEPKDVVLLAGGRLTGELLAAGVLKDVVLIVGNVLIGGGLPLVDGLGSQRPLELMGAEAFPPTTTLLRYTVPSEPLESKSSDSGRPHRP